MSIAACVVLYNPDDTMLDNILSYSSQVDRLFIIDNTPGISSKYQNYAMENEKVNYVSLGENKGIAFALNRGCELAADEGYNWMLTMDQDSRFIDDSFFTLARQYIGDMKNAMVAIYAASYTSIQGRWSKRYDEHFDELHFAVTSGNLVDLRKWKEIGGFDEKLFIDEVDHDFCLKLRLRKYLVVTSKQFFMAHTVGMKDDLNLSAATRSRPQPLRFYYITRNGLLMARRYFFADFPFAFNRVFYLGKALLRILVVYPEKRAYTRFFFRGVMDFFRSRYGKIPTAP